jgi:hypothetical protein
MKRDMDLQRKILLAIEGKYKPGDGTISNLTIDGYDFNTIAEHCSLLYQQGLIKSYKSSWADNRIIVFFVGNLTSEGYDFLELVRSDEVWEKTKKEVNKKKLPETIEEFSRVAGLFIGGVVKGIST